MSERQRARAQRPRRSPAILEAARFFRARGFTAKQAWDEIKEKPFETGSGWYVVVGGKRAARNEQRMLTFSRDRSQRTRPITPITWQQRYWTAAAGRLGVKPAAPAIELAGRTEK